MSTAEELLTTTVCNDILSVDLNNRIIIIPKEVTNLGVESDDNVKLLHFELPRHYCATDLSEFEIRINYENAKGAGDCYEVKDAVVSEDMITFDWRVGRYACTYKGNVEFSLCLRDVSDGIVNREFNTTTAVLPVLKGLETGEAAVQEYTDLMEQWHEALFGAGDSIEQDLISTGNAVKQQITSTGDSYKEQIQSSGNSVLSNIASSFDEYMDEHAEELRGPRGFIFTPTVDTSGNISWINNGGLTNPTTRNIRGPQGFTFTPSVDSNGDISWTNDGSLSNPTTRNIRGPQGFTFTPSVDENGNISWTNDGGLTNPTIRNITGPKGDRGFRGFTFTPSVDASGNISWTNDGGLSNPTTRNITGPQGTIGPRGYTFTPSVDANGNISWSNDGGLSNPTTRNITGPQGIQGIQGFTFTPSVDENGNISWTNDGGLMNPTVRNITGPQGKTGPRGETITSIIRTSGTGAAGTIDTYTITTDDGNTYQFQVYNGADGEGAGDMLSNVYDTEKRNTDIFKYVDSKIGDIDMILDSINGE